MNEEQTQHFVDESDETGYGCSRKNIAETQDTIDDFRAQWGVPDVDEAGTYLWKGVQKAKGKARGELIVVDFGSFRAAYFNGED